MMSKTIIYHYHFEIFDGNAYLFQKTPVNTFPASPSEWDKPLVARN